MYTVSFPRLGLEFNLDPVALEFSLPVADATVRITWYGILIAVGLFLAMVFAFRKAKSYGIIADKLIDVVFFGTIGGLVGARLYYVAFRWENYKDDLSQIFKTWEGGMAIYGGLIGAVVVGVLVCKIRKVKILPVLDLAGMGFLIGQGIGRWGNFVNCEAFGSNTDLPWGMTGDRVVSYLSNSENVSALTALGVEVDPEGLVHPCFLYESLWCLLGFLLLFLYSKHRKFDGEVFLLYLIWYGAGRAVIEGFRTDSLLIGHLRVSQILAITLAVSALIVWLVVRAKVRSAHDPDFLPLYGTTEAFAQELAAYEEKLKQKKEKRKSKKQTSSSVEVVEIDDYPKEEPKEEKEEADSAVETEEPKEQEKQEDTHGAVN